MRNGTIERHGGFWERAFRGVVEARTRQADREVSDFVRSFDDVTLAHLGYVRRGRGR
jgi:hypothetical protein